MKMMPVVTGFLDGGTNIGDVKAVIVEYIASHGGPVDTFECSIPVQT